MAEGTGGTLWNQVEETLVCIIIQTGNSLFAGRPLCLCRGRYPGAKMNVHNACAPGKRTFHKTSVSVLSHHTTDAGTDPRKNLYPENHQ